MTSKVYYEGNLRTRCIHLKSGNEIITDAPIDNSGKGEAFSPTDTVATALASCMITVMGIKAVQLGISFINVTADVQKTMSKNPRRISKISIVINLPLNLVKKDKMTLEKVGNTCPVHNSLDPKLIRDINYNWI
ncbi:MAG: OsmC family protein [Flavobacteriaceae bacterium]|jgi:uncharacterized OsmC-like protein|nr:OsmC family protein [Flavobacteriaceae bacterium]MBT4245725.1 OsmC family protein [Flavobacteriaceae bacterium]MBT4416081.1 OsmC family protein [Flavobacteriaceae bacterium]MBT5012519.1 OsmC family protein [Flavobacteriaceae bacterium]MBT5856744.1 OsmC family protein [Flavobacteriaceae bacterium]